MHNKLNVSTIRKISWLTLIAFFVFSIVPFPGQAAVIQTVGVDGRIIYTTDADTDWDVANFDQVAGAVWEFNLLNGNLNVNVNSDRATTWAGKTDIFGPGILGIFNRMGFHTTSTAEINLHNADFIGAAMRSVDGIHLKGYELDENGNKVYSGGYALNEGKVSGIGNVAFLGRAVENKGTIDLPLNKVTLGAGDAMTVGLSGDNLVSVVVDEATSSDVRDFANQTLKDQITNSGNITGHKITLDAKGIDSVFEKAINLKGEIKAVDVDTNDKGELALMSLDDIYSKAILKASKIVVNTDGKIESTGTIDAKEFREHGYTFKSTGTLKGGNAYFDNADHAADISGNLGSNVNDTGDIRFVGAVNLTDNVVLHADSGTADGSGKIIMQGYSLTGNSHDLELYTGEDTTLDGSITGVGLLTLNSTTGTNKTYTSTGASFSVNTVKTNYHSLLARDVTDGSGYHMIYSDSNAVGGLQYIGINSTTLGYNYKLANNIDASETSNFGWNSGAGFNPIGNSSTNFTGSFDGNSHIISNLRINRFGLGTENVGLFGYVDGTANGIAATIHDIGLTNASISGGNYVGGLVGYNDHSIIANSYVRGSISGYSFVGGLVGLNSSSSVTNSNASGSVSGSANSVGGLVGYNYFSSLANSYASGSVTGGGGNGDNVGGLVGFNYSSSIANSYATGEVFGNYEVGGLIGRNFSSSVSNSYAKGLARGNWYVGGLVGSSNNSSSVANSYANGPAMGNYYVGGLVGFNSSSSISNSYASGNALATYYAGGLVGQNTSSSITNSFSTGVATSSSSTEGGSIGRYDSGSLTNNWWYNGSNTFDIGSNGGGSSVNVNDVQIGLANAASDFSGAGSGTGGAVYLGWDFTEGTGYWNYFSGLAPRLDYEWATSITTLLQLQNMNLNLSASYTLANDIDASETLNWNVVNFVPQGFNSIGTNTAKFTGTFDGQNHTISNLYINRPTDEYVGLFGYVDGTANVGVDTIHDIGLNNANITGRYYVGGLAGYNQAASIANSYASGSVTGKASYIGGLIGFNNSSNITNSYTSVSVSGNGVGLDSDNIGGLIGYNNNSDITDSYASGSVTGNRYDVGGLVGTNNSSTITRSYAIGNVNGSLFVGGLIGGNGASDILSSYASGNVSGQSSTGGLVGLNSGSNITRSHATGTVTGFNEMGGLVGNNFNSSNITNSYASGSVIGDSQGSQIGGLVGQNSSSSSILSSYASGDVSGGYHLGGLAGINSGSASITNSYASGSVSGSHDYVGGLVGSNYYSASIANSYATGVAMSSSNTAGGLLGLNGSGTFTNNWWYNGVNTSDVGSNTNLSDAQIAKAGAVSDFYSTSHAVYNGGDPWDFDFDFIDNGNALPTLGINPNTNIWIGSGAWSDSSNWSLGVVPTALSVAYFGSNSVNNSTMDSGFAGSLQKLRVNPDYIGTITQNRNITVSGRFSQGGGTYNANGNDLDVGALTFFGGTFAGLSGAVNVQGGFNINGGAFTVSGGTVNVNGLTKIQNSTYTGSTGTSTFLGGLDLAGATMTTSGAGSIILGGNAVTHVSTNASTISGNLDLGGVTRTFTVDDGDAAMDLDIAAVMSNGGVIKAGAGTQNLSGNNTYTGATTVNAGTFAVSANNALGTNGSGTTVAGGATLDFKNVNYTTTEAVTLNGGTISTSSGTSTFAGDVTLGNNSMMNVGGTQLTLSGAVGDSGSNLGMTKSGSGTLILNGTNTYGGTTTISAGTLQIGAGGTAGTLGSGAVTDNATLKFNRTDSVTVGNAISGSGNLTQAGSGTTILTGANSYGTTTISAGTLQVGNAGTAGTLGSGAVSLSTGSGLVFNRSDATTVGNVISGNNSGTVRQSGSGALTLTGNSTYQGVTTIDSGTTVQLGSGANGGTTGKFGSGNVVNNGTLILNRSNSLPMSNSISGTGALTKTGTGTTTMSGNNTYSGLTTISAGTLSAQSNTALGSTAGGTTVASGAALEIGGFRTIAENLTLNGTGISNGGALRFASGSSNSTVSGTVTLGSDSSIYVDLNAVGALTLSGALGSGGNDYDLIKTGGGTLNSTGTVNLGGDLSIGAGSFVSDRTKAFTVGGNFSITNGATFRRFDGGGGAGNPFHIYDIYGLQGLSGYLSNIYYFDLANNIDASATSHWSSGFNPIGNSSGRYAGHLDGKSHTISNLFISRASTDYVGLFGAANSATISNVGLLNANISGRDYVGGLVGQNWGSYISGDYVTGSVNGRINVGGLIGDNEGLISLNYSAANVTGSSRVGGLVGLNLNSTISNSYATGAVNGTGNSIGGLVGALDGTSSLARSFASGNVSGNSSVGGLIGETYGSSIESSFATGGATATANGGFAGGIVGYFTTYPLYPLTYSNNWWANATNQHAVGGGAVDPDFGNQAVTASDFYSASHPIYTDWNLSSVWALGGGGMPDLRNEYNVWIGGASSNWSNAANWSKGALTAATKVMFDATNQNLSSVIDAGFSGTIAKIFMDSGFGGTLSQSRNLTVSGGFAEMQGNSYSVNSNYSTAINGAAWIHDSSYSAGSGTTTFGGGLDLAGATLSANTGHFVLGGDINSHIPADAFNATVDSTIAGNIDLGGGTRTFSSDFYGLDIQGAISNGSLTVGSGTIILEGANTYSGTTTINRSGYLQIGSGGVGGTLGSGAVIDNGTLTFFRDAITVSNNISGTGGLATRGWGITILTGINSYSGTTNIQGQVLQIGNGGTAGTLGSGAVTNNGTLTLNRSDALTVSNAISGAGTLTKSGAGTVTLTGANSYSGTTTVSAGTLQVGNGGTTGNLGAGTVSIGSMGKVIFNRRDATTISNTFIGQGDIQQSGSGTLTLTRSNYIYSGTMTIDSGAILRAASGVSLGSGLVVDNGLLLLDSGNFRVNNTITGSGDVTKTGAGILWLTANNNTYSGLTTISSGSTLDIGGWGSGSLGSGAIIDNGTISISLANRVGGIIINNDISGTGDVSIGARGTTVTRNGRNDYTGLTTISSGTLLQGGAAAYAGALTVSGSGTYDANGQSTTVAGLTTVSGGTYQAESGTQTYNSGLTISGGTYTGSTGLMDVNGDFTQSGGTVNATAETLRVSGNWNHASGTFNAGTSNVILDGTNQTVFGSTTFNNLNKTALIADTLMFEAGTTQAVNGALTLTGGGAGKLLSLRSTSNATPAARWNLDAQGTRDTQYANVKDLNNLGVSPLSFPHSVDSGNNLNVLFPPEALTGVIPVIPSAGTGDVPIRFLSFDNNDWIEKDKKHRYLDDILNDIKVTVEQRLNEMENDLGVSQVFSEGNF